MTNPKVGAEWVLELQSAAGEVLYRREHMPKRDVVPEMLRALKGDLPPPHYPWQMRVVVYWAGEGCPCGHEGDKAHPAEPKYSWDTFDHGQLRQHPDVLEETGTVGTLGQ